MHHESQIALLEVEAYRAPALGNSDSRLTLKMAEIEGNLVLLRIENDMIIFTSTFPVPEESLGLTQKASLFFSGSDAGELEVTANSIAKKDANHWEISLRPSNPVDAIVFWSAFRQRQGLQARPAKIPKLPDRGRFTEESRQTRLSFLQRETGVKLDHVQHNSLNPDDLRRTVESFVGTVEIPIGIAGPLLFHGQNVNGMLYAPMATTEGSLVASATRGATAITHSGGVHTAVLGRRITRAPLFQMHSLSDALLLADWLRFSFESIRRQTKSMSRHAVLKQIEPEVLGRDLHVHFIYDSQDAAGQNMTTGCTWKACHWIIDEIKRDLGLSVRQFLIESNLSNDKKVSFNSLVCGRGTRAVAECTLSAEVTKRFLHVTPVQLAWAYQSLARGGVAGGMIGININIANMVAALFTSTGQDIASVHESSIGLLSLELAEDNMSIYASLMLPSLLIGTVGGGTNLPRQRGRRN